MGIMQEHLFRATRIAGSVLLISILPANVAGQVRSVVSNRLAISQTEAALNLEFADDGTLDIVLRDGSVMIDGEERGSFELGDALDTAWRNLLGEIVPLSDGPLGEALRDWEAPSSLDEGALELAQLIDRTLETALRSEDVAASSAPDPGQSVQELENLSARIRLELREELRLELDDELRQEFRDEERRDIDRRGRGYQPLRAVGRGITEVGRDLITFVLLSLLALGTVYFAKDKLEIVANTARRNPMQAGMVGLAGAFLVVPAWVLGCVALAVSVVGIIALPFWLMLFPVVVALGAGLGYLAVAKNVGEWVASRNIRRLEWLQPTNTFYAITAGIGALLVFPISASILDIVPIFGFFSGLLAILGALALAATLLIGFGAVLLTRGGREADFYGSDDPFVGGTWRSESTPEDVLDAEEFAQKSADKSADESTGTGTKTGEEDDA
jgi:hypothetical protein